MSGPKLHADHVDIDDDTVRRVLNLGFLAHVDAGKTTLTERLLHAAGVIDQIGSVDRGTTQTDFLELERRRGITIRSAVVSFALDGVTVNLIDTPGHPDFIAEVERVLDVLDGVVLLLSAVEGVQAQTRVLMRALQRLRIPTVLFVNKIDRAGARDVELLGEIRERLTPSVVAMGTVRGAGSPAAAFEPFAGDDRGFAEAVTEVLAQHDDAILSAAVDDGRMLPYARLRGELVRRTRRAEVHPVFFGSAKTGAGVDVLTRGIAELLPGAEGRPDGDVSGAVFKVERGQAGDKVAFVRMFAGTLHTRDRVRVGAGGEAKVTAIGVFEEGSEVPRPSVETGRIAKVWGLHDVRIGDAVGAPRTRATAHHFAPPTLETVVVPEPGEEGAVYAALSQLAEQDPLIGLRLDDVRQEMYVSLYGEVQKEVIGDTLALDYGLEVGFRETTTICIERPVGPGEAVELKYTRSNPFPLGAVGLRVEPRPAGSSVSYEVASDRLGTMPRAFFKAVEETVHRSLDQGLRGWRVTDCAVTLVHTGYTPRQSHAHQRFNKAMSSTAGDFRLLVPLVLMAALKRAGTVVCEPVHRFRLEMPVETLPAALPALAKMGAVPDAPVTRGRSAVVEGEIPAARTNELQLRVRALTRGEGVLEYAFDRYEPVCGAVPVRPRTDHNPLDRKEYLLHVAKRF